MFKNLFTKKDVDHKLALAVKDFSQYYDNTELRDKYIETIKDLLNKNKKNRSPEWKQELQYALNISTMVPSFPDDIIYQFLEAGAEDTDNAEALGNAVEYGREEIVKKLLSLKKSDKDRKAYVCANDNYALRWAVNTSRSSIVNILLAAGAEVEARNYNVLITAVREWRSISIIQSLLDAVQNKEIVATATDVLGKPILKLALEGHKRNQLDIVNLLIKNGAVPDPEDNKKIEALKTYKKNTEEKISADIEDYLASPNPSPLNVGGIVATYGGNGKNITYKGKSYKIRLDKEKNSYYILVGIEKQKMYIYISKNGKVSFRKA